MQEIPVYLFTGFLEAGKTKFMQGTLEDERFNSGEKTLLLVCEEGEEEYDASAFSYPNVSIHTVENESDLKAALFMQLQEELDFERVMIEYNGMWQLKNLYAALPDNYIVYQELLFIDAQTILGYNANMRSLVVDKLSNCDAVIFNRVDTDQVDTMTLHKLVRGISRRAEIAYELTSGEVLTDDIEDPLPFDINADVIEIHDRDYALWYRDLMEEMGKYNGKTVRFKGVCARDKKMKDDTMVIGRHVMTCCVEDISYMPVVCVGDNLAQYANGTWLTVTARISIEKNKIYRGAGPVLYVQKLEKAVEPEEAVATFY